MARLNKRVKLYIVRSLATYETPTETAKGVQEEFGITVTKQQCEAYDPTKKTGQDLSEEFKKEFYRIREDMNKNVNSIPIANIAYRLTMSAWVPMVKQSLPKPGWSKHTPTACRSRLRWVNVYQEKYLPLMRNGGAL